MTDVAASFIAGKTETVSWRDRGIRRAAAAQAPTAASAEAVARIAGKLSSRQPWKLLLESQLKLQPMFPNGISEADLGELKNCRSSYRPRRSLGSAGGLLVVQIVWLAS